MAARSDLPLALDMTLINWRARGANFSTELVSQLSQHLKITIHAAPTGDQRWC